MNVIKTTLIFGLVLITQASCSQKLSLTQINSPSKDHFKFELGEITKSYENNSQAVNQAVDEETYYFNKRMELRNKVLDSLNILKSKRIIIVDAVRDFNGKRNDASYFFHDNVVTVAGYDGKQQNINGETVIKETQYIKASSEKVLKADSDDVLAVYNYFNKSSFGEIQGEISFGHFVYFNVTVIMDDKVAYYTIRSDSNGYKVKKFQ